MSQKSSFLIKLTIIMLLLTLVPLITIGTVVYFDKIKTAESDLENELRTASKLNSERISEWISTQKQQITSIAENKIIIEQIKILEDKKTTDEEKFQARIVLQKETIVALHAFKDLEEIIFTNLENHEMIFYTSKNLPNTFFLENLQKLDKRQIILHEIFLSETSIKNQKGDFEKDKPVLWITIPMFGEDNALVNVSTRVNVGFEKISRGLEGVSSADSYIVDQSGTVLSQLGFTNKLLELQTSKQNPIGSFSLSDPNTNDHIFIFKEKNHEVVNLDGYENYIGETVVGVINPIHDTNWYHIIEIQKEEAFIELASLQIFLVWIISMTVLVVTCLSVYFSDRLFKPIKQLTEITKKVSEGDLSVKIESKGTDEIHTLSESFNDMIKSVNDSIQNQRESENKFRALYNLAPTLNRTIDDNGKIIDCNDAYAKRLGYTKEEVLDMSIFEHCDPDEKEKLEKSFKLWKDTGSISNFEISLKTKDGTIFPGLVSATSIYDKNGKLTGSNSVIIDISKRKDAEAKLVLAEQKIGQERLLAIGELGARLAHDIRNPLAIINNTKLLFEKDIDPKKRKEHLEIMDRAIDRINHQINNVLEFVRNPQPTYQKSNLDDIVNNTLELIEIPENISIKFDSRNIKCIVDKNQMEVVFTNLLRNSVEAIGEDKGEIVIEINETPVTVIIKFSDTGPGIPDKNIEKIFDPLFTTKQTGTGLGLAGCKSIINEHGGKIDVRGFPTTFTIILPKFNKESS